MSYRVLPVTDGGRLNDFLRLPFAVYRGDSNWVPPIISEAKRILDVKRNPYFAQASLGLFVCYKDGAPPPGWPSSSTRIMRGCSPAGPLSSASSNR